MDKSREPLPSCCYGATIAGRAILVAENWGDPLGSFPSLLVEGCAYNLWLTGQILDVVLARWSGDDPCGAEAAERVARDIAWACGRARLAFQDILPVALRLGDSAILAALGVTANLQRTVALLGESILDTRPVMRPGLPFRLSRLLCGLVEYPEASPYFPCRIHPPVHASRLHSRRKDPRHLSNALWCSAAEIERCCDDALAALRREIRRDGLFTPGDLHHLHAR